MNPDRPTAISERKLEPPVVLPFVRHESGRVTTIALVSFRSEFRNAGGGEEVNGAGSGGGRFRGGR